MNKDIWDEISEEKGNKKQLNHLGGESKKRLV